MAKNEDLHIGRLIERVFRTLHKDCDVKWLAERLHCDRSNVYGIFKRNNIDVALLNKLGVILKYDFFNHISSYGFNEGLSEDDMSNALTANAQFPAEYNAELSPMDVVRSLGDQCRIGMNGTPKDLQKAYQFYLIAAASGDAMSQFRVAEMLEYGHGVEKSLLKALEWYVKSAGNGCGKAVTRLKSANYLPPPTYECLEIREFFRVLRYSA